MLRISVVCRSGRGSRFEALKGGEAPYRRIGVRPAVDFGTHMAEFIGNLDPPAFRPSVRPPVGAGLEMILPLEGLCKAKMRTRERWLAAKSSANGVLPCSGPP